PRFCAMLDELGVETRPTTMSFSVSHDGLEWGSESLSAVFAQRWRALDPRHYKLLADVLALLRRMRADVAAHVLGSESLDDYVAARRVRSQGTT
ncbi:MAG TPA: hypothetical protein VLT45_29800, partial [Kofleriaceae bacterium]|nr:hypothetical protein [Kofleriaceae bacterium]